MRQYWELGRSGVIMVEPSSQLRSISELFDFVGARLAEAEVTHALHQRCHMLTTNLDVGQGKQIAQHARASKRHLKV